MNPPVPAGTCPNCGSPLDPFPPRGRCPRCALAGVIANVESKDASLAENSGIHRNTESTGRIFGDYELLEEIAHGGMGVVWRARQRSLHRIVAVKMLLFGLFASHSSVERFRREAFSAASLRHPGIVTLHEVGEVEGQPFFSMEYVEGSTLAAKLKPGPLPARLAAEYCKTVAEAVAYAHEQGIVHRDLKPSNILIDIFDQPRVTDFGLAKPLDGSRDITLTGQILGSPNYLAPELAGGQEKQAGPATDVYALGAILYECLTGRPPFLAATVSEILLRARDTEAVAPRALNPTVPRDLEIICLKCLEKEPAHRYQTARELADELDRSLKGEPIDARPEGSTARLWRWCRRKPALATSFLSILILLVAALIGSTIAAFRIKHSRNVAVAEKKRAEAEALRALHHEYAADMNLVQVNLLNHNMGRVREILDKHRPGRRATRDGELEPGFGNSLPEVSGRQPQTSFPVSILAPDLRGWEWRHFWQQARSGELATLGRHSNLVFALAALPDGQRLVSSSKDHTVSYWGLETGQVLASILHPQEVRTLALSPDGHRLATGCSDRRIRVFDVETRGELLVLTNRDVLCTLAFSPDGKHLAAGEVGGTTLWNLESQTVVNSWSNSVRWLTTSGVAFSPDARLLAANRGNGGLGLYDMLRQAELATLTRHTAMISAITFSPDSAVLVSGDLNGVIHVWDVAKREPVRSLDGHSQWISSIRFSKDGSKLLTASTDQTAILWDTAGFRPLATLKGHEDEVWSAEFSMDGQRIFTAGKDSTIRVWPGAPKVPDDEFRHFGEAYRRVFLSPQGESLLAITSDGREGVLWDTLLFKERRRWPMPPTHRGYHDHALGPGGLLAASGGEDGSVRLWDAVEGRERGMLTGLTNRIKTLKLSDDGTLLLAGTITGQVGVWHTETLRLLHQFQGPAAEAWGLGLNSRNDTIVSGFRDGTARVLRLADGALTTLKIGYEDDFMDFRFTSDGRTLLSAGTDAHIRWWDWTRPEATPVIRRSAIQALKHLALSPDGRRLAASRIEGHIDLWDMEIRQVVATLGDKKVRDLVVAFRPDGQTLVSASSEGIRLYHAPSLEEIRRLEPSTSAQK